MPTTHELMAQAIRAELGIEPRVKGVLPNVPVDERAPFVSNPPKIMAYTRNGVLKRYAGTRAPGANAPVRVPSVNPYPADRDRPDRPGRGNRAVPAGTRARAGFVPDMSTPAPEIRERRNVFESNRAPVMPEFHTAADIDAYFRAQRPAGEGKQQSTTKTYGVRDLRNPGGQRPKSAEEVVFVRGRGMNARKDGTRAERDRTAQQRAAVEFERLRAEQGPRDALIAAGREMLRTAIAERSAANACGDTKGAARAKDKITRAETLIKMQGGKL